MPVSERRGHRWPVTLGLVAIHAALHGCVFEPVAAWPLIVPSIALLTWAAIGARSTRAVVLSTFAAHLVVWLLMSRWMANVTPQGYPLVAVYMSLYPAAYCWLLRRVVNGNTHTGTGTSTGTGTGLPLALLVPVLWVGLECIRGRIVFSGYPWYLAGHPLIDVPLLVQSADLFGAYFISILVTAAAGGLIDALRRRWTPAIIVVVLLVLNVAYGAVRMSGPDPAATLRVCVIQTNLPQDNKLGWSLDDQALDVPRFIEQTRAAAATHDDLDLIVWPETMLPGAGFDPEAIAFLESVGLQVLAGWGNELLAVQHELDVSMLIGSPTWLGLDLEQTAEGHFRLANPEREYNSAYLLTGRGGTPARYDKRHLTPFGETMPYVSAWPWLEARVMDIGAHGMRFALSAGEGPLTLQLPRDGAADVALGVPICYEDTISPLCRRMMRSVDPQQPRVLINLSNDGWFGDSVGTRASHNQAARFRCIENRVPMVRAVNTGQSVAIDATGKVIATVGPGRYGEAPRAGSLVADLPLLPRTTLYARVGDTVAWLCLIGTALLLIPSFRRRRGDRPSCESRSPARC